jgi:uncharacterized integral membrane protein
VGRLVFSIVLLLLLVAIIAFNAGYTSEVNVFGYRMSEVPTVAIGLTSFVLGVLYSFLLYLMSYFGRRKTQRLAKKKRVVKVREQELAHKEDRLEERDRALDKKQSQAETARSEKEEAASTGRRTAGKTLKNAFRTFFGQEEEQE